MKPIHTRNRHGTASAHDGDGNRTRISSTALSYDEGHQEAARALCEKMEWYGTLIGAYHLVAGRTEGMIWVWQDERSPTITVKEPPK